MTSTNDRIAELNALLTCDCAPTPPLTYAYRPACDHDDRNSDMRSLLIDIDDDDLESDIADTLRDHLLALTEHAALPHDESATQSLSLLRLDYSLCPMHHIDYAICFDDDDDECATIRAFFPIHDT